MTAQPAAGAPASAAGAPEPLLAIRDLEVTFQSRTSKVHAVRGASLALYAGRSLAIVGESGSGKSTTAHAVIGLLPAGGRVTGGSIRFEGRELAGASEKTLVALRGGGIGLVPQDPMSNLNPVYRVGAQIREALAANGIDASRSTYKALASLAAEDNIPDTPRGRLYLSATGRDALLAELAARGFAAEDLADALIVGFTTGIEVQALLMGLGVEDAAALAAKHVTGTSATDRVAGLLSEAGLSDAARRARQYPHEFSGGMRQRALIAMALAARPKLLIADEPTSALDVTVQRQILDHLGTLTRELGTAMLLITHDLGLAAERAEDLVVMYKGKVVESGPSLEVLTNPRHPYTQRLVEAAPSLASRRIQQAKELGLETAAGAEVLAVTGGAGAGTGPDGIGQAQLLEVRDVTKVFPLRGKRPWQRTDFKAVDGVSLTVRRGTTAALVGESGSGKSTIANMVLSLLEPTSGSIVFDGVDTAGLSRRQLFEFRSKVQPVFQDPYGSLDPAYSIYRIIEEPLRTHRVGNHQSREARVKELLDKVALPAATMRRYPNELSGGQRQRVAVARALALDPQMVVLDEAVSALDVLVQAQVLELLGQLQRDLGLTYLFITHDLAVVRQMADEVYVMERGRIVEQGPTDRVFERPEQAYTKALLEAIPGSSIDLGRG
ncbi:MAG: ABC transporter ATP-binding protein [Bifidobacteriaceae bacterium]|jgi:peptide/nickel transport system ATP-binding protein|nr:ABC transporter ATP-binding protein [Bifidobacteriaceae bacterium]